MSIIDICISIIAPHHCIGCGLEGALLCRSCDLTGAAPLSRCYRCHRLTESFQTCRSCRSSTPLASISAARTHEGLQRELVKSLKFNGAQSASYLMASKMSPLIHEDSVLIPLPTVASRARHRGYDQTRLLTRDLTRITKCPSIYALSRIGKQHQVGARRQQRLIQLQQAFIVRSSTSVRGLHIVLIDDVSTTGATLEAAAKVLKQAGAKRIDAVVYAQAQ